MAGFRAERHTSSDRTGGSRVIHARLRILFIAPPYPLAGEVPAPEKSILFQGYYCIVGTARMKPAENVILLSKESPNTPMPEGPDEKNRHPDQGIPTFFHR